MEVAQAIRRQAAALTFGVLQQSLRLSDPENDGVALGQWARQAPITAGSVEHAAAFMKAKELPQTVYFSGSALWWKEPTPNAYIVRVEKVSPPLVHKTVDSIQAKCNAGYERVGLDEVGHSPGLSVCEIDLYERAPMLPGMIPMSPSRARTATLARRIEGPISGQSGRSS